MTAAAAANNHDEGPLTDEELRDITADLTNNARELWNDICHINAEYVQGKLSQRQLNAELDGRLKTLGWLIERYKGACLVLDDALERANDPSWAIKHTAPQYLNDMKEQLSKSIVLLDQLGRHTPRSHWAKLLVVLVVLVAVVLIGG